MSDHNCYIVALRGIRDKLASQVQQVTLRGEGASSFLFVEHDGRAVELYSSDSGGWIVERWETSDDEDAASVGKTTVQDQSAAVQTILGWLKHTTG